MDICPNNHIAAQATNTLQEVNGAPCDNTATPDEQSSPSLPNRLNTHQAGHNNISSNNSQSGTSLEGEQVATAPCQILMRQPRIGIPSPSYLPHILTQRLTDPTQDFLALGLDLNRAADREFSMSPASGSARASPTATAVTRSRSRSRSRSPNCGRTNLSSPWRNSSPDHILRSLRASPGAGPNQLV